MLKEQKLGYLLVLLELDIHITSHLRELSMAITLPKEVTIAYLQQSVSTLVGHVRLAEVAAPASASWTIKEAVPMSYQDSGYYVEIPDTALIKQTVNSGVL